MSKKARERKLRKMQRRGLAQPLPLTQGTGNARQAVLAKIARDGEKPSLDHFIRILADSHTLRQEPEFRDVHFDLEKTVQVSSRVMTKYEKQIQEMEKKSEDERHQFRDDVRIEIIDELATPAFRKDVLHRLESLSRRLATGNDADKFEIALYLQPLMQEKQIPWGICGLITTIYAESAEKAEEQFEQGLSAFDEIFRAAEREGKLEQLLELPEESPEVLKVVQQVKSKPGLMDQLRRETEKAFQEFEQALMNGEVKLDLFTKEELLQPFAAMTEYISANQIEIEKADQQALTDQFAQFIKRNLDEVMTKDRAKRMKDDMKKISAQWLRDKNVRGALLQGEISILDSEKPSENPFLYAAYVGQMKNLHEPNSESDEKETVAPASSSQTDARSIPPRGWRERIKHVFRKR